MYGKKYQHILDENECVEVYKGLYYDDSTSKNCKKVIVFDLDETLGSFVDLDILWNSIDYILGNNNPISHNNLLDLYPEFLRPNILNILKYVFKKKKNNECYKLYIYTNNQSQSFSVNRISEYLSRKISKNDVLFDQIIYAFKINNQVVQVGRSSHHKTYNDLINCTLLPKKTAVCFLDDAEFDEMKKERIYYIKPKAYRHNLSTNDIINRLFHSRYGYLFTDYKTAITEHFINTSIAHKTYRGHVVNSISYMEKQKQITMKMMYHIREFFLLTKTRIKTRKKKTSLRNFTRKNRK